LARARSQEDVHLSFLGDGEERGALVKLANDLDIAEDITWLGFQSDPYPYVAAADIFVLTSDYEGLSNALLEAQGLGLPAVVTDCRFGNAEVVSHGKTGFVCPVGESEAIARRIVHLAQDTTLRKAMSEAASARIASHFSLQSMLDILQSLIDWLLKAHPASPKSSRIKNLGS
jgi:glycosyltransferase involved in cell wall biosynthesis